MLFIWNSVLCYLIPLKTPNQQYSHIPTRHRFSSIHLDACKDGLGEPGATEETNGTTDDKYRKGNEEVVPKVKEVRDRQV